MSYLADDVGPLTTDRTAKTRSPNDKRRK